MTVVDSDLSVEVTPTSSSSGAESVPGDPEDFGRPRALGVPAQVGSPQSSKSLLQRQCQSKRIPDNQEGDRRRFTAAIREVFSFLDLVDLKSVFRNRACLIRVALTEFQGGVAQRGNSFC